ncbi:MAG: phosphoribosyltransferase [Candidatus Heimdallarchaeaceae archaeon]
MVEYELVSWDQSYQMAFYLFEKMTDQHFVPDVIVGIARGGWIPARLIADFYGNKRTANIKIEFYDDTTRSYQEPIITQEISENVENKVVLVVDDVADSGKSLNAALAHIKEYNPKDVKSATLYYKPQSILKPDFFIKETVSWIVFPWEYGEFTAYLYRTLKKSTSIKDIKRKLKDIGIPSPLVEAYFSLVIQNNHVVERNNDD